MPEQTHPPYVSGALTTPRFLCRWLDINPQNGPLSRTQKFIQVLPFNINHVWNGYSEIVGEYHFIAPNNFSLKQSNLANLIPSGTNYTLCVSYVVSEGVVARYSLVRGEGDFFYFILPEYNGQFIAKNFVIEIWNTNQVTCSESGSPLIYTSVRGDLDYRYGVDSALATTVQMCSSQQPPGSTQLFPISINLEAWLDGGTTWTQHLWSDRTASIGFTSDEDLQSITPPNLVLMSGSTYTGVVDNPVSFWVFVQLGFSVQYPFVRINNGSHLIEVGIDINSHLYCAVDGVTISTGVVVLVPENSYIIALDSVLQQCNIYSVGSFALVDVLDTAVGNLQVPGSTVILGKDGFDPRFRGLLFYNDQTLDNTFYTDSIIPYLQSLPAGGTAMTIPLIFDPCSNLTPPTGGATIGIG